MDKTYKAALDTERESLLTSPERAAKYRRINEIDDQLQAAGYRVTRVTPPADLVDAADHTPRERAVRGRKDG